MVGSFTYLIKKMLTYVDLIVYVAYLLLAVCIVYGIDFVRGKRIRKY